MDSENKNDYFFKGGYQDVWRHLSPDGLTQFEVNFVISVANLQQGSKVLDLMCGYGRHTIPLLQKGIFVTAVDNLDSYINSINELHKGSEGVETVCCNVLEFEAVHSYDAVLCLGSNISFFNWEQLSKFLSIVSRALKPDGFFILNSWQIAEIALRHFKSRDWYKAGEFFCVLENTLKLFPTRVETVQHIIRNGYPSEIVQGVDYIYTLDQVNNAFLTAGLNISETYGTPNKKAFSFGDPCIYIVARKSVS